MYKSKLLFLLLLFSFSLLSQVSASSFVVQNNNPSLYYGCPFDVDIYIDTQGEEAMGASIDIRLQSGLNLDAYIFGEAFNLQYPYLHDTGTNVYKIFTYKFPGVFSGTQKFVTLRLVQNENITNNKIVFITDGKNYSSNNSWTNIFYLGGKNSLTSIQNAEFVFSTGTCPVLLPMTGDVMGMSQLDLLHNASSLIDQFAQDQKTSFWQTYSLYIMISGLLLLIIASLCYYFWKKKK